MQTSPTGPADAASRPSSRPCSSPVWCRWPAITHAHAAPGDGSVSDPNIAYVGRWDTSSGTTAVANWTGAYVQTSFTGTTVKVKARDAVNFYVSVDGGPDVFHAGVRGTVNLTPSPWRRARTPCGSPTGPGTRPSRAWSWTPGPVRSLRGRRPG